MSNDSVLIVVVVAVLVVGFLLLSKKDDTDKSQSTKLSELESRLSAEERRPNATNYIRPAYYPYATSYPYLHLGYGPRRRRWW